MKAQPIVAIAAASAGVGAFSARYAEKAVPVLQNKWINTGLGVGIGILGWLMDMDGVGDAVEGFGIGYTISAIL